VWYDNPKSLQKKAAVASELGLRGVGMWNLDCLDYSCVEPDCQQQTAAMWGALRAFTGSSGGKQL
jgi:di-N-acetylchitobiase